MLAVIVSLVAFPLLPLNVKLVLCCSALQPVEVYVHSLQALGHHCAHGKSVCCAVVCDERGG
eukprot:2752083-Ditylum_brightwellii.AAC.1